MRGGEISIDENNMGISDEQVRDYVLSRKKVVYNRIKDRMNAEAKANYWKNTGISKQTIYSNYVKPYHNCAHTQRAITIDFIAIYKREVLKNHDTFTSYIKYYEPKIIKCIQDIFPEKFDEADYNLYLNSMINKQLNQ